MNERVLLLVWITYLPRPHPRGGNSDWPLGERGQEALWRPIGYLQGYSKELTERGRLDILKFFADMDIAPCTLSRFATMVSGRQQLICYLLGLNSKA
jgi:hypothetical protein